MSVCLNNYTDNDLAKLFPWHCSCVKTRGTQEGTILKFPTYYLKIYDGKNGNSYIVQGYRYDSGNPIFTDNIPVSKMREYASKF